jgi:NADH-quinone oxidoreductase subunit A
MAESLQLGYLPILILGIIAMTLVFATLLLAKMMAPRNPNARKESTYECGEIAMGSGRGPVEVQYYMYILVFLIIDIEAIFLIPFAVRFADLGPAAIWEMAIFVGLLFIGWLYALKKGALNWVR